MGTRFMLDGLSCCGALLVDSLIALLRVFINIHPSMANEHTHIFPLFSPSSLFPFQDLLQSTVRMQKGALPYLA